MVIESYPWWVASGLFVMLVIVLARHNGESGDSARLEKRVAELERDLEKLKREVRRGEVPAYSSSSSVSNTSVPVSEIEHLLRLNQKIAAIKLHREHTQLGLKEAKEAVEEIERRMR